MDRIVSYKREMKHNYLMIEGEPSKENQYETKMLISNPIEGLLRLRIKRVDTLCYFCYEITSRQPLSRLLESRSIKAAEIRQMIIDIAHTLTALEEYLLKEEQVLLEPEFIYVEPDLFGVELCLLPGREGDFPGEMSKLLEYLLGKVDYQDKDAVVMVYGLYRESLKENYGMDDLFRLMMKEGAEKEVLFEEEKMIRDVPIEREEKKVDVVKEKLDEKDKGVFGWGEIGAGMAIVVGSLVILWLLTGTEGLWRYGAVLTAVEVVLMGFRMFLKRRIKTQEPPRKQKKRGKEEEDSWQMVFDEDRVDERKEDFQHYSTASVQDKNQEVAEGSTVLLLDMDEKCSVRRLEGLEKDTPDILISYYPFIIGKQENLVDFMLERDTVSRLHMRLDESNGSYRITDLNSTNGTAINGKLLENNEISEVKPGDEVQIANYKFKFV